MGLREHAKRRLVRRPSRRPAHAFGEFLAATLNVSASAVKIVAGKKSRNKRVLIEDIMQEQARKLTRASNA